MYVSYKYLQKWEDTENVNIQGNVCKSDDADDRGKGCCCAELRHRVKLLTDENHELKAQLIELQAKSPEVSHFSFISLLCNNTICQQCVIYLLLLETKYSR